MKIQISRDAHCGKLAIPKGDYWVSMLTDGGEISFVGGGKDYKIPAKKRRATVKSKTTQISFYSGGGRIWSLVVSTPKFGEWIALIEYDTDLK